MGPAGTGHELRVQPWLGADLHVDVGCPRTGGGAIRVVEASRASVLLLVPSCGEYDTNAHRI